MLTRLRHTLPEANCFIDLTAQTIQWRPDAPVRLDVAEFETAVLHAVAAQEAGDHASEANALAAAADVYTGEQLPDCFGDWSLPFAVLASVAAEVTKVYLRARAKRIDTTLTAQMELA